MPYYDTIAEDLARAKAILDEGRGHEPGCPAIADDESDQVLDDYQRCVCSRPGGTIYGKDTYAAYRLLESFVAAIERQREELVKANLKVETFRALVEAVARVPAARIDHNAECLDCDEQA